MSAAIGALRKQAAGNGRGSVTAVLLGPDGTYNVGPTD